MSLQLLYFLRGCRAGARRLLLHHLQWRRFDFEPGKDRGHDGADLFDLFSRAAE